MNHTTRIVTVGALIVFLLGSCSKKTEEVIDIIDPKPPHLLLKDTIRNGTYLGVGIGEPANAVYLKLQYIALEKKINHLMVTGAPFKGLDRLKNKLHLYGTLRLSNKDNGAEHVLFVIEQNKIVSIFNSQGQNLLHWPQEKSSLMVPLGMDTHQAYEILHKLQLSSYAPYFTAISTHDKLLKTGYDAQMTESSLWYLGFKISPTEVEILSFHFSKGQLQEITRIRQE